MLRQPVISAYGGLYCALRAQLYPYRGYIDRVRGRVYFTATVGGDITCHRQISPEHREDLPHAIGVDITARHSGRFPYSPSDATSAGYIRQRRVTLCPSGTVISLSGLYRPLTRSVISSSPHRGYYLTSLFPFIVVIVEINIRRIPPASCRNIAAFSASSVHASANTTSQYSVSLHSLRAIPSL